MFPFYFQSADHIFNLSNAENEKEFSRVGTLIPPMTKTDMGRSDSQQLPKFSTFDYFRSNPEILWVSPLQRKNEDSIFTDNVDAVDLKDETPAEFHPVSAFHVRTFSVLEVIFLTKKLESLIAD